MYIIAGLGNPGNEYADTRHNIGFAVVDALAKKHGLKVKSLRHRSVLGKGSILGHKVFLQKPLTYMNLSGEAIVRALKYYRLDERKELIVIADDINLPAGQLRIRKSGSDGGHKGLRSIIAHLGHQDFIRLRIGVGDKPAGEELVSHVLGSFSEDEAKMMNEAVERAVLAIETIISENIDMAMNKFNTRKPL